MFHTGIVTRLEKGEMQYLDFFFHYHVEINQRRTVQVYDALDNLAERADRNETMIYMIFIKDIPYHHF